MEIIKRKFVSQNSMSILQFSTEKTDTLEYLSLSHSLNNNLIEITEANDFGDVNSLGLTNKSKNYIFLSDGDILVGAKQNRVLNTSIFLAPDQKIFMPVSCVERGRWKKVSDKFSYSDYNVPHSVRFHKTRNVSENLRMKKEFDADQSQVWKNVDSIYQSFSMESATDNILDIYAGKEKILQDFLDDFKIDKAANGLAMFVGDSLLSIDIFNRREIFAEYAPRIIKSGALEIFHLDTDKKAAGVKEVFYKTITFLDELENIGIHRNAGAASGEETRYSSDKVSGFKLEFDNQLVHLSLLQL